MKALTARRALLRARRCASLAAQEFSRVFPGSARTHSERRHAGGLTLPCHAMPARTSWHVRAFARVAYAQERWLALLRRGLCHRDCTLSGDGAGIYRGTSTCWPISCAREAVARGLEALGRVPRRRRRLSPPLSRIRLDAAFSHTLPLRMLTQSLACSRQCGAQRQWTARCTPSCTLVCHGSECVVQATAHSTMRSSAPARNSNR